MIATVAISPALILEPIALHRVRFRIDGRYAVADGACQPSRPAAKPCRASAAMARAPMPRLATAAGAARLRGAAASGAPRHRARHVRDRLGRAAALLVAGVARAAARAGRSRHQHRHRFARTHHSRTTCARRSATSCGPRSTRRAAATTRTSTASRASTARPAGSCCAARPSSPRARMDGTPRARSACRRHHRPQARRGGERAACLDGAVVERCDLLDRSRPAPSAPGIRAPSAFTATRPRRRSAVRSRCSARIICTTSSSRSTPTRSAARPWCWRRCAVTRDGRLIPVGISAAPIFAPRARSRASRRCIAT